MKHFPYTIITLLALLPMMTSCQEDDWGRKAESIASKLYARKSTLLAKSVPPNSCFEKDTRYRLWAYHTDGKYIFADSPDAENGILAKESERQYIDINPEYAKLLHGELNLFGFTDGKAYSDSEATTSSLLKADGGSNSPTYTVSYSPKIKEGYNDFMRAHLHYNASAGNSPTILEFKHIFSRIRVQVIQQGRTDESGDELTGIFDLKLHSAEIDGVYDEMTYEVVTDRFTLDANAKPVRRTLNEVTSGEPIIPAEAVKAPFSESYILPTPNKDKDKPLQLRLLISGADAPRFSNERAEDDKYAVNVPLYDHINKDEDGNYKLPLLFEPNCSYMLRVVFTKDGIVLFTPMVYPWFDGETEGWENGEGYEEQVIGNTFLFGNLIWSDRNLGAEDYLPNSEERFKKCTGFFYQFGRNIPYFPMENRNGKLTDNLTEKTPVYPVISHPKGRFHGPSSSGKESYITSLDNINALIDQGKLAGYRTSTDGFNTGFWENVETQPGPPGWRLPKAEEFYTIMPTTPHAGNITFMKDLRNLGASNIGGDAADFKDEETKVIYIHVPNNQDYPNYPANDLYYSGSGPTAGNVVKMDYDPSIGYSSEYVLSRAFEDECGTPEAKINNLDAKWGTIYGIKKVGTDEAYRMRWHIENTIKGENMYYLVIERFTASSSDRLTYKDPTAPDYYRNYDWSRPVAVLYIPICGMIGDDGWSSASGKLGNYGTETILATSTKVDKASNRTYRIKIYGSNRRNQYIYPAQDRNSNGAQIRLVRESTYVPN